MTAAALPNILAMISSLAAMISLALVVPRLGGQLGVVLRLVIAGVFLSVFVHAAVELAEVFGLLTEGTLMFVMGCLVSLGSLAFCAAGIVALRALR